MKSNTGEIEVFLCPEYNTNTDAYQPQSQLRPYISQVSIAVKKKYIFLHMIYFIYCIEC